MKNITLILSLVLFTASVAFGQIQLNPKVGFNSYKLRSDSDLLNFENQTGYNAGLDFRIGDGFYLAPGIHYYVLDAKLVGNLQTGLNLITDDVKQENLKIPVIIGGNFIDVELVKIRLQAGAVASIPMAISENNFGIEKEDFNDVKWGGTAGVGLDLGRFTFDANFELGFQDILPVLDVDVRESLWTFSLGFLL